MFIVRSWTKKGREWISEFDRFDTLTEAKNFALSHLERRFDPENFDRLEFDAEIFNEEFLEIVDPRLWREEA